LDYFQGILFLTTNRVGGFDEAFMSRIHVQIGYDPLDDDSRAKIWNNHFKKLARNHEEGGREIHYSIMAQEYVQNSTALRDLQWNGREIRNGVLHSNILTVGILTMLAFQTAVALASFEAKQNDERNGGQAEKTKSIPKLTEEHIGQVVKMSQNFKRYIKDTIQSDDASFALQAGLRSDRTRAT
jgi:hypothetical protein